ncbi:helix-turn-helix transcriptional regulator [Vibrio astriarenae]|uniref:helix-turn-helix transcriptional regulator n=1 Tax=Vibrio astriarenae TaxID=1481923 RepID=UPI00373535E2
MNPIKSAGYITTRQVCERLGISRSTLERYVKTKGFPKPLKLSATSTNRYPIDAVLAWEHSIINQAF